MKKTVRVRTATAALCVLMAGLSVQARDNPTSYGEVARVDTPILRVPFMAEAPSIDGVMEEGEWADSSSLSGFWYDFAQAHFLFLAPMQTQLQVYAGYDKENLYLCYSSPVYPENSWLRSRGRFPDITHHPRYGLIGDDHIELELRPHHDNAEGFRLGLFKWFGNAFDTVADLYWSQTEPAPNEWQSEALFQSVVTPTRWTLEIMIPFEKMVAGHYTGNTREGQPIVNLPPPDGTAYRAWFVRGIHGNGDFFNVFDKHSWNTTKTKLVFDSSAPVIQVNELGPIMEDIINVQITLKNHNTRSETVRLGFFVESQEGMVYSSYDSPQLEDGLLELRPGEVKKLRLQRPFPGISRNGNTLWFDVRSAGRPYKTLFLTRLIDFHHMDGGEMLKGETIVPFRQRRIDVIETMRPPRRDFEFTFHYSSYTKRLQAIVDTGIHGASDEAKRAKEAKLALMKNDGKDTVIRSETLPIEKDFACFLMDVPEFENGESYRLSLVLFDEDLRIMGERNPRPFKFQRYEWQGNQVGLDDVVWAPFTAIERTDDGFETLKHRFTLAPSGLPAQIFIKPHERDLPLEMRGAGASPSAEFLSDIGRGPQLRRPIRLIARVDGKEYEGEVTQPATPTRVWQSEIEYVSELKVGPLDVELRTQYDCDGAMSCSLTYGSDKPVTLDGFEMLMDVKGPVDLKASGMWPGMVGADIWECGLPMQEGVIWDSADMGYPDLFYTHFIPWFWFGSGDRAFTWFCDSDKDWILDRKGSTMTLERNAEGAVTWRTKFVNHTAPVSGQRTIDFTLLTHPSKSKPKGFRNQAWFWRGGRWADEYFGGDFTKPVAELKRKRNSMIEYCDGVDPATMTEEEKANWAPQGPLYWRYYQNKGIGNAPPGIRYATEEDRAAASGRPGGRNDQIFEDKIAYWFERHVRIGRRHGWWWDETWPTYRSSSVAEGDAYLRDPEVVKENELPWQDGFLTGHMRNAFKRLARVMKTNGIPNRNFFWANTEATTYESFGFDAQLVEECGGGHRTFDVDMLQQFPNTLWRRMAHNYSGLVVRFAPENGMGGGDDPRLTRSYLGIAMLHDIGCAMAGPHGKIGQLQEAYRTIGLLRRFGYFEDDGKTEYIPFWRNKHLVQYAPDAPEEEPDTGSPLDALEGDPEISVYRRPLEDGRNGVKVLIVLQNERDDATEYPLTIAGVERILGGPNTLTAAQVLADVDVPPDLGEWWAGATQKHDRQAPVLLDLETGDPVACADKSKEKYGPIYVPYHNHRVFYAEHAEP